MNIHAFSIHGSSALAPKRGLWSGTGDTDQAAGGSPRSTHSAADGVAETVLDFVRMRLLRSSSVVRMLSLGAPVAAACVEAARQTASGGDCSRVELHVVDDCAVRLRAMEGEANRAGVQSAVRLHPLSPWDLVAGKPSERWDLIDAMGILDQAPFHEAMALLRQARPLLKSGGLLVASQLMPRPWSALTRLLRSDPTYRRPPTDLRHLVTMAGYGAPHIHTIDTPAGPTAVALCAEVR